MRRNYIILIFIVIIAAVFRLYRLSDVPPGVNRDEASIGFTAFSLAQTGRDEYGKFLPVSFQSFGDWKLPFYIYTDIPFVKTFGESELAVRLPSALSGIASVALLYFLTLSLFGSEPLALISAAVLAVMPWHIHISRVESESNVAILMMLIGSLLFLSAIRKKSVLRLVEAAVLFSATYYTYHGNHIYTSLLLVGMFVIYFRDIIRMQRWWIALCVGGILTAVILSATLLGADRTKISGISIFGDPTVVHNKIELPRLLYAHSQSLYVRLIYNRVTFAAETVWSNYLKAYGPQFLFISGGTNHAHNIQGFGNLYPLEAPFLLLGVAWLIANRKKKSAQFILWWIIIGGIPAAITKDAPHSNREFAIVPVLALAVSAGVLWVYTEVRWKKLFVAFLGALYLVSIALYLNQYYVHFAKTEAASWGYAYKKLTPILFSPAYKNDRVIMTHPEASPYIYLLFYSSYSPALYQTEVKRYPITSDGFRNVSGFGRFSFRPINWQTDPDTPHTLLVTSPDEIPGALSSKIIATVRLPDNTPQFVVVDTDK